MRFLLLTACVLIGLSANGEEASLREADSARIHGRYEDALRLYDEVLEASPAAKEALLGKVHTLREIGKYAEAEALLDEASSALPAEPDNLVERADYLLFRGRWDDCDKALDRAFELDTDHLRGHLVRGMLADAQGDKEKADTYYDHLYNYYNYNPGSVTDPAELTMVGQAAVYFRNFHDANRVFHEATKKDPEYLPAFVERGLLFLRAHSEPQAREILEEVLLVNPNHSQTHLGIALAHLSEGDFPEAEEPLKKALKTNPSLPGALCARALTELTDDEYEEAESTLEKALEVNPKNLEALGLAAFSGFAQNDTSREEELEQRAFSYRDKPVAFFIAAGEACAVKRWSREADGYFARALQLDPEDPRALGNRGLVLMRLGREEEAKEVLDKAFERDRFDKRVYNSRIVLGELRKYPLRESEHFHVRIPREKDSIIGELFTEQAEEAYRYLEDELGFTPELPVILEVFDDQGLFAARVTGLPRGMPTGVCLGRVIAMRSPAEDKDKKAFNWNQVLRHELAHVFTLGRTGNRIPRWFTEGLSVHCEGSARVRQDPELCAALEGKRLLDIEELNRGFTRPTHPGQVSVSYRQSSLVAEFLVERWGMDVVAGMLSLFAEGKTTEEVIPEATGLTLEEFNAAMFAYLEDVVYQRWRARPELDPSRLGYYLRRIERSPEDARVHLQVARLYFIKKEFAKAREHAQRILELNSDDAEALEILARVAEKEGDAAKAREFAGRALEVGGGRFYPHMVLGLLFEASGEIDQAIAQFEKAKEIRPRYVWRDNPYQKLAELYERVGRKDRSLSITSELLAFRDTDTEDRIKLARAYLADSSRSEAISLLEETLHIIPFDASVYGMLGKAYLDEATSTAAVEVLSKAVKLAPDDALYRLDLATAYHDVGEGNKALEEAWEALRLDPHLTEAEELIESLGG